ncbi:MAG: plasmid recombination protein [Rhodospirillaceae bacterium]|nr:plasmid recombination protein [Rhodospirillaceae bacterium]
MTNPAYAILRVKALKGWSAVSAMARHGRREGGDTDHIDKSRSSLNRYGSDWSGDPRDLRSCIEAVRKHHGATNRKGAPVGSHLLLTASASYFRPDAPDSFNTYEVDKLENWLNTNLAWINQRWPQQIAAWRLDLDESTPHLDVFLVPVAHRRTRGGRDKCEVSHREAFGKSRKSFAALQNDYAAAMAPLGLARGRPRSVTGAIHIHPARLRLSMKQEAERQRALRIGSAGILRRDVSNLRLSPNGMLRAKFGAGVPAGVHARFLGMMQPAASTLIQFDRHVQRSVKRLAHEVTEFVAGQAEADRQQATDILDEAQLLHAELSRLGMATPSRLADQLDFLVGELVR